MQKFKNAFVITGTIGSGKSSFAKILKDRGYDVLDADKIGHIVLNENADLIVSKFGECVLKDGVIDRKKLGNIVFGDKILLAKLNQITHQKIMDKIYLECERLEAKNKPYFVEISLYFENFSEYRFENIIVVYALQSELFGRIKERNGWDDEHINARLNSQISIEKKRKMAKFVIDNSKDYEWLKKQTDEFLKKIRH